MNLNRYFFTFSAPLLFLICNVRAEETRKNLTEKTVELDGKTIQFSNCFLGLTHLKNGSTAALGVDWMESPYDENTGIDYLMLKQTNDSPHTLLSATNVEPPRGGASKHTIKFPDGWSIDGMLMADCNHQIAFTKDGETLIVPFSFQIFDGRVKPVFAQKIITLTLDDLGYVANVAIAGSMDEATHSQNTLSKDKLPSGASGNNSPRANRVVHYQPEEVVLIGTLTQKEFLEHGKYGGNLNSKKKRKAFILALDAPINVITPYPYADSSLTSVPPGNDITEVQLYEHSPKDSSFLGKRVEVVGQLYYSADYFWSYDKIAMDVSSLHDLP